MTNMKQVAKRWLRQATTATTWDTLQYIYWLWLKDTYWYRSRVGRKSARRLGSFHNQHKGQRCFIIGNGPSLKQMDLNPLRNEFTFGLNRIYLLFSELSFATTYLVSVNRLVIDQSASEISALQIPKFIDWRSRGVVGFDDHTVFLRSRYGSLGFSTNPSSYIYQGATVTYVALQLAYYMGFKDVYLIGVDHNFVTKGTPHKEIVSTGSDPNHFSGEYFGKGFRWQLPDLETSEMAYRLAREAFEQDGRQIMDATVGGKLKVYPKVQYRDLF